MLFRGYVRECYLLGIRYFFLIFIGYDSWVSRVVVVLRAEEEGVAYLDSRRED